MANGRYPRRAGQNPLHNVYVLRVCLRRVKQKLQTLVFFYLIQFNHVSELHRSNSRLVVKIDPQLLFRKSVRISGTSSGLSKLSNTSSHGLLQLESVVLAASRWLSVIRPGNRCLEIATIELSRAL